MPQDLVENLEVALSCPLDTSLPLEYIPILASKTLKALWIIACTPSKFDLLARPSTVRLRVEGAVTKIIAVAIGYARAVGAAPGPVVVVAVGDVGGIGGVVGAAAVVVVVYLDVGGGCRGSAEEGGEGEVAERGDGGHG
jgi:hypothetical protein